jgi:hypothetical protein
MNVSRDAFRGYFRGHRSWRTAFSERWGNAGKTRQRKYDGYLPLELDYATGAAGEAVHAPQARHCVSPFRQNRQDRDEKEI